MQSAPWYELGPLKVRIGLHTGEAELDPGGDEYAISHIKNRIGRIHSAAHGGQVLLLQETADLVALQPPEGISLKDLSEHRLKSMQWPEPVDVNHKKSPSPKRGKGIGTSALKPLRGVLFD